MPRYNSEAMSMHLEEIAFHVAPGVHAALVLDQAGWHGSAELVIPPNITLMPLPLRCPELNPVENLWKFMRDNLAVEPHLQVLRRYRRSLLPRLEHARRSALAHHVHRTATMGSWVMINALWY
jgi:hypothetical protein